MTKITINDWQTIQSRKEIQSIRKTMRDERVVDWSILVELFLLVVGFCLNNIFGTEDGAKRIWIILSVIAFVIPIAILGIGRYIRFKKADKLKQTRDVREMVTMFDDELCYYVMTAGTFFESKIDPENIPAAVSFNGPSDVTQFSTMELQKFYYIEASYYLNKSVNIFCLMKNNVVNIIEDPTTPGASMERKISYFRFQNVIMLMTDMYGKMKLLLEQQEDLKCISLSNDNYIIRLNDFITECNRVLKVSLPIVE